MRAWDAIFPEYGLASHKGYSTPEHYRALEQHRPDAAASPELRTGARAFALSAGRASGNSISSTRRAPHDASRDSPTAGRSRAEIHAVPIIVPPPIYHWYHKMSAVVFITFCLEMGLFLLIFPWTESWDGNYFSGLRPQLTRRTGTTCMCAAR